MNAAAQDPLWTEDIDLVIQELDEAQSSQFTHSSQTSAQIMREKAIRTIDNHRADVTLYTDGSCSGGTEEGGAAVVITTGPAANPVVSDTLKSRGGRYTCSYEEERRAMVMATEWIKENRPDGDTVICSDSQSLLKSMVSSSAEAANIREILDSLTRIPRKCQSPVDSKPHRHSRQ